MNERRCPACNRFKAPSEFRKLVSGKLERDCIQCVSQRIVRQHSKKTWVHPDIRAVAARREDDQFPGVDIDAIHYKLGKVRRKE